MKLHLIDGTYELFRSHFGAPPAKNAQGMEVEGRFRLMNVVF